MSGRYAGENARLPSLSLSFSSDLQPTNHLSTRSSFSDGPSSSFPFHLPQRQPSEFDGLVRQKECMLYLLSDTAKMNDTLFFETFVEVILMFFFRHKSCESPNPTPISFVAFLMKIHGKACERQMEKELYRIYFTPEMEVFYMLFERCHTKKRQRYLKQHVIYMYFNFRSIIQLDHPVLRHSLIHLY